MCNKCRNYEKILEELNEEWELIKDNEDKREKADDLVEQMKEIYDEIRFGCED